MTQMKFFPTEDAAKAFAEKMEKETQEKWVVRPAPLAGGHKAIPEAEERYWEENPPKH